MTQQEKEMIVLLQHAARLLAEIDDCKDPRITAFRAQVIDKIKRVAPEYYGLPA